MKSYRYIDGLRTAHRRRVKIACVVSKEKGAIIPMLALSLIVIISIAGLAVDSSHAFLNITRLQNALDAAALSAAKTLNTNAGNTDLAAEHGTEAFNQHLVGEFASSATTPMFEFAENLNPFISTTQNARFVRVSIEDHSQTMWFSHVLPGIDKELLLNATAVAGPIPLGGGKVCDVAPMIVCGDPDDTVSTDGTYFGLNYGDDAPVQCLKSSRNNFGADDSSRSNQRANNGNGNGNGNNNSDIPPECEPPIDAIGPGNFQLTELGCGSGANCVRLSLAGTSPSCLLATDSITTKPGNAVGPTAQGLNTRFGIYQGPVGPSDFPPDLVTTQPLTYSEYQSAYYNQQFTNTNGRAERRVLAVPIGNCSAARAGRTEIPILGFGCYFMTQPTQGTGQNNWVIGHLIEGCKVGGSPGENPGKVGGGYSTYKIILYNDPDNLAS